MCLATRDVEPQLDDASAGAKSEEMKILDRAFSRAHAMSIHLNLISIGATVFYGWHLASKLTFDA